MLFLGTLNRLDLPTHLHQVTLAEVASLAVNGSNLNLQSSSLLVRTERSRARHASNVVRLNQEAGRLQENHRKRRNKRRDVKKDKSPGLHDSLHVSLPPNLDLGLAPNLQKPIVKKLMSSRVGNLAGAVKKKKMSRRLRLRSQAREILNQSHLVETLINNPKKTRIVNMAPAPRKLYPGRGADSRKRSLSPSQRTQNLLLRRSSWRA